MPWITLVHAAAKYDLHPLALMSWIDKDHICGSRIGNDWYVDDATIQEFIGEHHPMSMYDKRNLRNCLKELKEKIDKEIQKGNQTLFTLCSLSVCNPIFERILKDMSELIDDTRLRDIFYSLSTGVSKEKIAQKWNSSLSEISIGYRRGTNLVLEGWQSTADCRNKAQELAIRCRNYKQMMENRDSEEELPYINPRIQEIPNGVAILLRTSLEKLEIDIKVIRLLRKNNLYLLEDLLRFIKKNGYNALERLPCVGPLSCTKLLDRLIEIGIMTGKDSCYLFQYLVV